MVSAKDHKQRKELIILIASLVIGTLCIVAVIYLQYKSFTYNIPLPEYSLAFFSSIATLVFGYVFGRGKS